MADDKKHIVASSRPTYTTMNDKGHIEIRDLVTDQILFYQGDVVDDILQRKEMVKIKTTLGTEVLVDKKLKSEQFSLKNHKMPYCDMTAELIVDHIANGGKISQLPRDKGFPSYSVICRWRQQFPEFEESLAKAMKMKSDLFMARIEDEVMDLDAEVKDDLDLKIKKTKLDNIKWLAEKHDSSRFGKGKSEGGNVGALQIIVNTGIVRDEDNIIEVVKEDAIEPGREH